MRADSDRTPLMLLHGFTDTPRTWDPLLPLLEPEHELIAPALLGHRGGEPLPPGAGSVIAAMVAALERVLDERGHRTVHVVGNSLGGWLAFELAARGRARSVVALSPGHGWTGDEVPRAIRRRFLRTHRLAPLGARLARRLAARPRLRRLALHDFIAHPERVRPSTAVELILGAADCPVFEPYSREIAGGGFRSGFGSLGVPVRIAWGTRDRVLPIRTTSSWFRDHLPDAEWVDLPDCGHLPQHDDPQLVARVVLELTRSADRRSRGSITVVD